MNMNFRSYNDAEKFLELTRVAQRVMVEYQQAVLGIVYNIKNTLNFDDSNVGGIRHKFFAIPYFQEYKNIYERGAKVLGIKPNMWAWDFNYSSVMEYHLGECQIFEKDDDKKKEVKDKKARMSVIAIPDTSIYIHDPNHLESFSPAEECASKLVFVMDMVAIPKTEDNRPPMWKSIEECDKYISDQLTNTPNEASYPHILIIDMAEAKDEAGLNTVIRKINDAFFDKYGYKLF